MKKLLLTMAVLMFGCQNPASTTNTTNTTVTGRHVMNSLWQVVPDSTVNAYSRSISRSVIGMEESVALYNASHIDDQWFIVDGDIPGIDDAPAGCIYIVDKVTHNPISYSDGQGGTITLTWPDVTRRWIVEHYAGYLQDAQSANGELYIDVIPPAPTPPTAEQVYAAHQIYVINNVGDVKYHYDCSVVPDGWPGYTPDTYISYMLSTAGLITRSDGVGQSDSPWSVVSGQVYTEPTP